MGKFQKVMDEKSKLDAKVEELNSRLTAATRAKTRLQEQLDEAEKELAASREEAVMLRRELAASKRAAEDGERRLAETVAKSAADLQKAAADAAEQATTLVRTCRCTAQSTCRQPYNSRTFLSIQPIAFQRWEAA